MNPLIFVAAPFISGIFGTMIFGKHSSKTKIPGLLFHSVLADPELNLSHFSSSTFCKFVNLVHELQLTPVTICYAAEQSECFSNQKRLLITFDDGLENIKYNAIDCLNKFNFKSTIFCVSGFTGKKSTWDVYNQTMHLNASEIRSISDNGHEIGSHTHTHANLTNLTVKDLIEELRTSKRVLEDITGKEVKSISFPHGSWNQRVWNTARDEGYKYASLYRGHYRSNDPCHFPVLSAGRFDSEKMLLEKIRLSTHFSPSIAFSKIASQFAKGTPLWRFRMNYNLLQDLNINKKK